jgi:radical SAM protein with 4Fe4S-binding SPASM domain
MLEKKPLAELLPLEAPLSVLIEPTNACNLNCIYCPTGDSSLMKSTGRKAGMMEGSLFTKIVNDMKVFKNKINIIHLFKDGEPLLHISLPEMVKQVKDAEIAEIVSITTNGTLLQKHIIDKFLQFGLDMIRISIAHVNEDGYEAMTGKCAFDWVQRRVELLYNEKIKMNSKMIVFVKIIDASLTEEERELFIKIFSPICDFYSIDQIVGWGHGDKKDFFNGKKVDKSIDGLFELRDIKVCPDIFKGVAINFDGTVSACCVDWCRELVIGDLKEDSFFDIWNGEKLRKLRLKHLSSERNEIPICANCQYVMGMDPMSELDTCAERLKALYLKE